VLGGVEDDLAGDLVWASGQGGQDSAWVDCGGFASRAA
jgi:hypothetical protein